MQEAVDYELMLPSNEINNACACDGVFVWSWVPLTIARPSFYLRPFIVSYPDNYLATWRSECRRGFKDQKRSALGLVVDRRIMYGLTLANASWQHEYKLPKRVLSCVWLWVHVDATKCTAPRTSLAKQASGGHRPASRRLLLCARHLRRQRAVGASRADATQPSFSLTDW